MEQTLTQIRGQKFIPALQIFLASCFIGLLAQIEIPLMFSPVPISGQSFGVMLVGAILGRKRGFYAALLYLFQGAIGCPVLAGGAAGFHHFIGPTGGYMLFYPIEAYLFGAIFELKNIRPLFKIGATLLIPSMQLGIGTFYLAIFVGIKNALLQGYFPFILLEIGKAILVLTIKRGKTS